MNKEQALELIKKNKWVPPAGCTYMPEPISEWMIETVIEAYDLGLRNGRLLARDWE